MHNERPEVLDLRQRELVVASARGDHAGFDQLVREYQSRIRAYAQIFSEQVNEQVDDLAQEIFLQVFLSTSSFKMRSTVSTWIFSIAKNTINNKIRRKKMLYFWQLKSDNKNDHSDSDDTIVSCEKDGEYYYQVEQDKLLIKTSLAKLSPEQREIIVLFEYSNLAYNEISEVLRLDLGTVKSRLFNARKALANEVLKRHER